MQSVVVKSSTARREISGRPIRSKKKKKRKKFFGFPRPHDALISRRPLQGLVGNIRGEASSPSRREDTQGEHWQARWTPGRPISPSSVKCELFDKIDEGSRGREGGRVCAGRRVGRGRGGVCACASHYAKLFDPWFNISTELSSLSLYLSPSPIFTIYKCSGCCRIYGAGIREWGVEERDWNDAGEFLMYL